MFFIFIKKFCKVLHSFFYKKNYPIPLFLFICAYLLYKQTFNKFFFNLLFFSFLALMNWDFKKLNFVNNSMCE